MENIEISGIKLINRIDEILSEKGKSRKEFTKKLNIQPNTMIFTRIVTTRKIIL